MPTWLRLLGAVWFVFWGLGGIRMARVYRRQETSPLGAAGSPSLIAVNSQRAWINLLSIVPVLAVPGWAAVTYLIVIRALGSLQSLIRCRQALPPFESFAPGQLFAAQHKSKIQGQAIELGWWTLFLGASIYFLRLWHHAS